MKSFPIYCVLILSIALSCRDVNTENALAEAQLKLSETEALILANREALEDHQKRIQLYEEVQMNLVKASNDDHTIHVDLLHEERLRFSLWNQPKSSSSLPKVVVYDGTRKKTGNWGVEQFAFEADGQSFMVETVPINRRSKQHHVFLEHLENGNQKYYGKMVEIKN